jgi:hypothetical protein
MVMTALGIHQGEEYQLPEQGMQRVKLGQLGRIAAL